MNIKMPKARFIDSDNGIDDEVKAIDINSRQIYKQKYFGKLFCIEKGCDAKLHHVDLRKSGGSAFFRTNPKSAHNPNCRLIVKYDGTTVLYKNGDGEAVEVPDEHINGTLMRRIQKHKEKISPKKGTLPKGSSKGNRDKGKNPIIPKKPTEPKTNTRPSLDGTGKKSKDGKGTRIVGREPQQITKRDFGKPRCVDGYIKEVFIYDDYAQIEFMDKGEYSVFIEFGQSFKEQYISAFNGLKSIKKYLNENSQDGVYCVCIGLVQERKDKVVIEVYKEIEFLIEELTITQFMINN